MHSCPASDIISSDGKDMEGKEKATMYKASDFTKEYYKPGEVATYLGLTTQAIQQKDRRGELVFERTDTNRRILPRKALLDYLDKRNMLYNDGDEWRRDVVYARIDGEDDKQHGTLDSQALDVIEKMGSHMTNPLVIKECGTGEDRPEMRKLIKMVMQNRVRDIYVTSRDRIAEAGVGYLETAFAEHGTHIVTTHDGKRAKGDA